LTRPQQETLFAEYERLYANLVDRFALNGANEYRKVPISWATPDPEWDDDPASILRGRRDE
jgi:hypothetical protein